MSLLDILSWQEVVVQNRHSKNAVNDCNCHSQQLAVLSLALVQLDRLLYLYSRWPNEPG